MYTHLHTHSWFSLGQGASSPEALITAAIGRGFSALACTDTNAVYGAVEFQRTAIEAGIRPILGAHLVLGGEECVALATDDRGWGAICRAITAIHWKGEPPSLADLLAADRSGALILSAGIPFLERIVAQSGPADIYAELRPGMARHAVLASARRIGVAPVVTNGVMFAHAEDWSRHRLIRAIALNRTLSDCPPDSLAPRNAWLMTVPELARHFPDVPDALDRAGELADRCRYLIPIGRIVPPRYAEASNAFQQLQELADQGAVRRYGSIDSRIRNRLKHELDIIGPKGFADYFLVVRDIVEHCQTTHCGRGSVANSIVSYCLGITHVDPLKANLQFERFLNPDRSDPPDIDLDFPWDERDRVLGWVFKRYPMPRAAMVANHNTLKLRGALREVAKVEGRPAGEIREVTRRIPWYSDDTPIEQLLVEHPNYTGLDLPAAWIDLARRATALVGTPRYLSLHPGGVVIVPGALTDYVPLEPAAKELSFDPGLTVPVIQFEKDGAEDAGLVKIDLLGNRSLAVIRDGIAAVQVNTGRKLDYTSADAGEDPATREIFRTGRTMGVFYTESPASRLLCIKSKAWKYEILVLNTSIIRPASNRFIWTYLKRLHGGTYLPLDRSLQEVLLDTYGVMVYQEDVANVCAAFAGMSLATADGVRKALSKKRPVKALAAYARDFLAGAAELGRPPDTSAKVWEMVMSFAGYSFCKGHSCSYILVAQVSAYLRAHYPAEFFAAVLSNGGGFYAPFAYVAEARRAGVTICSPDVNVSRDKTTGRGVELLIGLQFIKGLSAAAIEKILHARQAGPFVSLGDFRARTGIRTDDLRLLVKVGACDSIANGMTRPEMLWEMDSVQGHKDTGKHGEALSSTLRPCVVAALRLPEYSADRRRREEFELLGFSIDCHPMTLHQEALRRFRLVKSTDLAQHVGKAVLCAGMLTTAKPVHTAKDEPMQFATFDDGAGLIETVLFPEVHRTRGHVLFDPGPFVLRGKVEEEFGGITLTVTHLERLERMRPRRYGGSSMVHRQQTTHNGAIHETD